MARVAAFKFALTSFLLATIASPLAQAGSHTDRLVEGQLATIAVAELPRR